MPFHRLQLLSKWSKGAIIFSLAGIAVLGIVALRPELSIGQANQGGKYCIENILCMSGWPNMLRVFDLGDADHDLVPNHDDKCPNPPDGADLTPDIQQRFDHEGCPDKDGDTVFDNKDKCPKSKGTALHEGCPVPGNDNIIFVPEGGATEVHEGDTVKLTWNVTVPGLDPSEEDAYQVWVKSVGYDTFIAYEKRLRDSVEVVAYSSEQEYKLFVVSSKVKSIQVEKSPSLTIAVKKIEGSWSEPTPCTARVCGKGTQRQTCSTPSGGGSWCPLTWGARIIEGAPGGVRVQEKDCEAPAPCLERTRDVGCLNEEQFNSIQKCQNQTSADACKEKNESYVCNFSTSGWCFFAGNKITVTAVRCEAPSAGDMPQIYDVVYKETSNQIEVHTIRTDQLKVIQVDGATLSAPKETRLGEQYEYKTYWLFDLKDISKKEVAVKFEATRTHGVSSPLTITQESKIYPYMGAPKIVDDFRKGSFGGLCNVGDFNTEMRISTYHASRVTWKGDKGFNAEMRLVRVDEFGKQEWSSSAVRRKRCSYLPDDVANEVFKIVAENSYGVAEKQVGGQKDLTCGEGYCTTLD